ncbi:MAG: helix-turn-helix domain-containing protein [Planctomycetes bacterium]|nr:helix-turn-helix domain-containing protein [Planctomycetota bacterium]
MVQRCLGTASKCDGTMIVHRRPGDGDVGHEGGRSARRGGRPQRAGCATSRGRSARASRSTKNRRPSSLAKGGRRVYDRLTRDTRSPRCTLDAMGMRIATGTPDPRDDDVDPRDDDAALEDLARFDPTAAELVRLELKSGLSIPEIATRLGISSRTVERNLHAAREWMRARLAGG